MKVSCIIVEDEPLAMERIKNYVLKVPTLFLVETFENAIEVISFISSNQVDLIFLDINLGDLSGIQFLESTKTKSQIIITTAYHEYALKGYELNVTDYLLKPFSFERFLQAVNKVDATTPFPGESKMKFFFIKTQNRLEKVNLNDILFIEGMRDYRKVHTSQKKIMTLQTFTELETEIPKHIVCRVHKSFMVALDKIESIERDEIKIGDVYIPISDTYKKAFYESIGRS